MNPTITELDIPANMLELLAAFERDGRHLEELGKLRADYFSTAPIPSVWPRQWEIDHLNTRRGALLPRIEERAKELLASVLDPFHGEDPTLAAEVGAFTLWKAVRR